MSHKRKLEMELYRSIRIEFLRSHPKCQFPECSKASKDLHHRMGRSGALLCDNRHFSALCRPHHDWVGSHPKEAREIGLLCAAGQWNTPDRT